MKPRPDLLPLSEEDTAVWHLVVDRFYGLRDAPRYAFIGLWAGSLMQARRDADLMLYAQQHKLVTWVGPPMIAVRNAVSAYWSDPPWQGTLE